MGTPTRRRWIKLYPVECLDGSIRYQLEPDERGVWYDLLNFAAICSNTGTIADRSGRAFPLSFIANRLNISVELLETTLSKCKDEGRLIENGSGIHITNWAVYQSEYERQKPFRQPKLLTAKLINELTKELGRQPTMMELIDVVGGGELMPEEQQKVIELAGKELRLSGIDKQVVDRQNELFRLKKKELGHEPSPSDWLEIRKKVAAEFGRELK